MRPSKRDKIVETALDLFYQHGFHATGIEKVLSGADVARMTLYNHFKSKEELIVAVLRRRDENFRDWVVRYVEQKAGTPRDRLLALFDAHAEWFAEKGFRGCLFINAAAEFAGNSDSIHHAAAEHKRLIISFIRGLAVAAGIQNPDVVADQLALLLEGAIVNAQMSGDAAWAGKARDTAETLLDRA